MAMLKANGLNISDNTIDLNGYDIVRKDRSRNGKEFVFTCVAQ